MTDSYEKALDKLVEYIDQTVTFAKGELPEVATQIAAYGAASSTILMWVFIAASAVMFMVWLLSIASSDGDTPAPYFAFALLIFCVAGSVAYRMTLLKIETAPKLYVLEQVRELAGSR